MRDVRSSSIVPEGASPRRHAAEQLRVGTRAAVLGRGPRAESRIAWFADRSCGHNYLWTHNSC